MHSAGTAELDTGFIDQFIQILCGFKLSISLFKLTGGDGINSVNEENESVHVARAPFRGEGGRTGRAFSRENED